MARHAKFGPTTLRRVPVVGGFPLVYVAFWLTLGALGVRGALNEQNVLATVGLCAAMLALVIRALMLGCYFTTTEVVFRSWFATYRFSVRDVSRIDSAGYSGFANRFSESDMFHVIMVYVLSGGRDKRRTMRFTIARRARVEHTVDVLRAELHGLKSEAAGDPGDRAG